MGPREMGNLLTAPHWASSPGPLESGGAAGMARPVVTLHMKLIRGPESNRLLSLRLWASPRGPVPFSLLHWSAFLLLYRVIHLEIHLIEIHLITAYQLPPVGEGAQDIRKDGHKMSHRIHMDIGQGWQK